MTSAIKTALSALATAIILWLIRDKLHFDPEYYSAHFADQETHLGIPNFWNVATNLGFLVLGLATLRRIGRFPKRYRTLAVIFTIAVLGTAFGSAYFHYAPTPTRLFWDELPMSIGFASFVGMLVADRVCERTGLFLGLGLCVAGAWSVWNIYYGGGATEYYIVLQFGSLLFALLMLGVTRTGEMKPSLIWAGLAGYLAAKACEALDGEIYSRLGVLSGHSLKHIAATAGLWAILRGSERTPSS